MDRPAVNEGQLVEACRRGEEGAFTSLVYRYKGLISALAFSATCDLPLSQDLAQETFATAWRKLDTLAEPARLRAWLCGILKHLVQDALRRQHRESTRAAASSTVGAPPSAPSPYETAISHERAALVAQALTTLPEEYRLPLVLYYFEGRSSRAVGESLGLTEDTVRQRLARGRQRLREELASIVEETLDTVRPKRAFVLAVLSRLPKPVPAPTGGNAGTGAGTCSLETLGAAVRVLAGKAAAVKSIAAVASIAVIVLTGSWAVSSLLGRQTAAPAAEVARTPAAPAPVEQETSVPAEPAPPADAAPALETEAARVANQLDREGTDLAAAILDKAWRIPPMEAARGLCVTAWGYRAALGDERCLRLLSDEVRNMGKHAPRALQMSVAILGQQDLLDYVYDQCVQGAKGKSLHPHCLGYFGILSWSLNFLDNSVPKEVTDTATEIVERDGPIRNLMEFLSGTADGRARSIAEYYLLQSLNDPSPLALKDGQGGFRAAASAEPAESGNLFGGSCLADRCLRIIERVADPASARVLRAYLNAPGGDADHAAYVLGRVGDRDYATSTLRHLLVTAAEPEQRLRCAMFLAKLGEKDGLDLLYAAAANDDAKTRSIACEMLCGLGDPAFVEPAVRDFLDGGEEQFWALYRDDEPHTATATPQGIRFRHRAAFYEYIVRLATLPDEPRSDHQSATIDSALGQLFDAPSEYVCRVLPACLPALARSPFDFPNLQSKQIHTGRLALLIAHGDRATRRQAAERLTEATRRDPDFEFIAASSLRWAVNPEAKPLLFEIMKTARRENTRVMAAVAFLAIQSGKRL